MLTNFTYPDSAERLSLRKRIIDLIDQRREREGDAGIGGSIERCILADELALIEEHTRVFETAEKNPAGLQLTPFRETEAHDPEPELACVTLSKHAKQVRATLSNGGSFGPN